MSGAIVLMAKYADLNLGMCYVSSLQIATNLYAEEIIGFCFLTLS